MPVKIPYPDLPLDAEFMVPADADALLVLAHGAGAGMNHASMVSIATAMSGVGIATLRFNFPFMQLRKGRVDSQAHSVAAISAAAKVAIDHEPDLPLYLGGHSFGGRMASHAVVAGVEADGLVFCSFPLHAAKRPAVERAEHLPAITQRMLFLSGTRDALAESELLQGVVDGLSRAELHWLQGADHGYKARKRDRPDASEIFAEMADATRRWLDEDG